jgi:hypothetical protein
MHIYIWRNLLRDIVAIICSWQNPRLIFAFNLLSCVQEGRDIYMHVCWLATMHMCTDHASSVDIKDIKTGK